MISQKCIGAGTLLLQWGIVSEEVMADALVQSMKSDLSLLQILLRDGRISVYEQLFVLMESSTVSLSRTSSVARSFSSLPTRGEV